MTKKEIKQSIRYARDYVKYKENDGKQALQNLENVLDNLDDLYNIEKWETIKSIIEMLLMGGVIILLLTMIYLSNGFVK